LLQNVADAMRRRGRGPRTSERYRAGAVFKALTAAIWVERGARGRRHPPPSQVRRRRSGRRLQRALRVGVAPTSRDSRFHHSASTPAQSFEALGHTLCTHLGGACAWARMPERHECLELHRLPKAHRSLSRRASQHLSASVRMTGRFSSSATASRTDGDDSVAPPIKCSGGEGGLVRRATRPERREGLRKKCPHFVSRRGPHTTKTNENLSTMGHRARRGDAEQLKEICIHLAGARRAHHATKLRRLCQHSAAARRASRTKNQGNSITSGRHSAGPTCRETEGDLSTFGRQEKGGHAQGR